MKTPVLLPAPKSVFFSGCFTDVSSGIRLPEGILSEPSESAALGSFFRRDGQKLSAEFSRSIGKESYILDVGEEKISVTYADTAGCFYALVTLRQMAEQGEGMIPCGKISDGPDFAARGLMLDISRNKIPSTKTLKKIIDYAASLKLNQFQLYVEGKSFFYPSLKSFYETDCDIVTAEEVALLDEYCKERFIEFVPNQNTFGHMSEWLAEGVFRPLAECPEGFSYYGVRMPPSTLDPSLRESLELVRKQLDDLLPAFTSDKVNIGGDEPFELGEGKSAALCEKYGKGKVYFTFLQKIFDYLKTRGRRAMMWGDVFKEYADSCRKNFPNDVVVLEWGYEADSYTDEICRLYEDAKIRYYLCPGTSLWNTVTGKTENMRANVKSACRLGKKHGAEGILLVDWGDGGSCQPFVCTLLPYATGAAYAWNAETEQDERICKYLDEVVFGDDGGGFAQILADLGNYYLCADKDDPNATKIFKALYVQQTDCMNVTEGNYEPLFANRDFERLSRRECLKTLDYLRSVEKRLRKVRLRGSDTELYLEEVGWALGYLMHGCKLGAIKAEDTQFSREEIEDLAAELGVLNEMYERLWRYRNRRTGLTLSMMRMQALYRKYLAILG